MKGRLSVAMRDTGNLGVTQQRKTELVRSSYFSFNASVLQVLESLYRTRKRKTSNRRFPPRASHQRRGCRSSGSANEY